MFSASQTVGSFHSFVFTPHFLHFIGISDASYCDQPSLQISDRMNGPCSGAGTLECFSFPSSSPSFVHWQVNGGGYACSTPPRQLKMPSEHNSVTEPVCLVAAIFCCLMELESLQAVDHLLLVFLS